jgi:hypothetical protein
MTEAASQPIVDPVGILNGAAGIAAFSAPPAIVFNPGQSDTRDVNSYKSLVAACSTLKVLGASTGMSGTRELAFRGGTITIGAASGGTYDTGDSCTWSGVGDNVGAITLTGAVFPSCPVRFREIVVNAGSTTVPITLDLAGGKHSLDFDNAGLQGFNSGGYHPVIFITDSVGGGELLVSVRGNSDIFQAIGLDTGVTGVTVYVYDEARLGPFTSGDAASVSVIYASIAATVQLNDPVTNIRVDCISADFFFQPNSSPSFLAPNIITSEQQLSEASPFNDEEVVTLWLNFAPTGTYTALGLTGSFGTTMRGYLNDASGPDVVPTFVVTAGTFSVAIVEIVDVILSVNGGAVSAMPPALTLSGRTSIGSTDATECFVTSGTGATYNLTLRDQAALTTAGIIVVGANDTFNLTLEDASSIILDAITVDPTANLNITVASPGVVLPPGFFGVSNFFITFAFPLPTSIACTLATTEALPTSTYDPTTLTFTGSGQLPIDSIAASGTVLVKDQPTQTQNGFYTVTRNNPISGWVLTRLPGYPVPAMLATINDGAVNAQLAFQITTTATPIVIDTTAITFAQWPAEAEQVNGATMAVRLCATVALPANTYTAGPINPYIAGPPPYTLNATANGALTVDGVTASVGDLVLVTDEGITTNNGPYVVLIAGSGGTKWRLQRAQAFRQSNGFVPAMVFFVSEGTANAGLAFQLSSIAPITLDTSPITFVQFGGSGATTLTGDVVGSGSGSIATTVESISGSGGFCTVSVPLRYGTSGTLLELSTIPIVTAPSTSSTNFGDVGLTYFDTILSSFNRSFDINAFAADVTLANMGQAVFLGAFAFNNLAGGFRFEPSTGNVTAFTGDVLGDVASSSAFQRGVATAISLTGLSTGAQTVTPTAAQFACGTLVFTGTATAGLALKVALPPIVNGGSGWDLHCDFTGATVAAMTSLTFAVGSTTRAVLAPTTAQAYRISWDGTTIRGQVMPSAF